jgi:5-methyltetrahydropteroyltriglutamate--homocysteine methyltransferase
LRSGPFEGPATESLRLCRRILTVETAAEVRDRIIEAASILPVAQFGTTDDCGFAPFADDISTAREIAFTKIRARVEGADLAAGVLGC